MKLEQYNLYASFEKFFGKEPDQIIPYGTRCQLWIFGSYEFEIEPNKFYIESVWFEQGHAKGGYLHTEEILKDFPFVCKNDPGATHMSFVFREGYLDET